MISRAVNVVHFNTFTSGGAAIAAKRIHEGLLDADVNSYFMFKDGISDNSSYLNLADKYGSSIPTGQRKIDLFSLMRRQKTRLEKLFYLYARPKGFEIFSPIRSNAKVIFDHIPIRPDIIHLHWIAGFFDYEEYFGSIPNNVPIVWTLHDMNPFTGGCHYSWGCRGYTEDCGNCPQIANPNANDLSRKILTEKKNIFNNKSIHVVADSHWIESQVKESSLFGNASSVRTIHYGIEVDLLRPKDKDSCKRTLGINPRHKVIVFGAEDIDNRRKGLAELIAAIKIVKHHRKDMFLLTFGGNSKVRMCDGDTIKHAGYVASLDELSTIYSAADVFVMPSIYEAFGQVALEAMSCGVPVISFKNGGASDIVIEGVTGLLAERGDEKDLSNKLLTILGNEEERREMGNYARNMVVNRFSKKGQALKYVRLYKEITSSVRFL